MNTSAGPESIAITSPVAIAANDIGPMYHRPRGPAVLHDVEIEPDAEIVRVVCGAHTLTKTAEQSWREVLKDLAVPQGTYVNLHVENKTDTPRVLRGRLLLTETAPVQPAAISSQQRQGQGQGQMNGNSRGQRKGGSLMEILPPIYHGKDGSQRGAANPQQASQEQGAQQGSGIVQNLPPIYHKGGSPSGAGGFVGGTTTSIPHPRGKRSIIEQRRPRVEYHGKRVAPAPDPAPASAPVAELTEKTADALAESASQPNPEESKQPLEDKSCVLLLKGHGVALHKMLRHRIPLNPSFKDPIMYALAKGVRRREQISGSAAEMVVALSPEEITDLAGIMIRARGTLLSEKAAGLADAFERAIAFDEVCSLLRVERRTSVGGVVPVQGDAAQSQASQNVGSPSAPAPQTTAPEAQASGA